MNSFKTILGLQLPNPRDAIFRVAEHAPLAIHISKGDARHAGPQLDWLISTTAMIVLSWSRATRDLLKSFGWGIGALHRLATATMVPSPCTYGGRLVGLS